MTHSNARKLILAFVAGMTLFMWGMASPRRAVTWYVAPDGNDNNPGTLSSPFASITRAQAAASPGDTVYIRGFTYTSFSVAFSDSSYDYYHYINKSGISYFAHPGDPRPVFDFSASGGPAALRWLGAIIPSRDSTLLAFGPGTILKWIPGASAATATPCDGS